VTALTHDAIATLVAMAASTLLYKNHHGQSDDPLVEVLSNEAKKKEQDVVQADGALLSIHCFQHMSQKQMGTCLHLHLVLLFGNKDENNLSKFWNFVVNIHPSNDYMNKTILTN
jgi:hypothetical protein